jgi:hypothetical protein
VLAEIKVKKLLVPESRGKMMSQKVPEMLILTGRMWKGIK